MSKTRPIAWLADLLADLLKPVATILRVVSRPLVRGWRLASLRSCSGGSIPESTQFDGPVTATGSGHLRLGAHCRLGHGVEFDTTVAGQILIGERVRINSGTIIVSNSIVAIGDGSLIGEYVSIRDANHGTAAGVPIRAQAQTTVEIRIGRDVWIGRGCCILKGVTVGDGAVIGANSVVTRDIPAGLIYAGAPARQIGSREPADGRASTESSESTHAS